MKKKINCFIPFGTPEDTMQTVKELQVSELVNNIYLLGSEPGKKALPGCEYLSVKGFYSTDTMKTIAANANTEYTLFYLKQTPLKLGLYALERMVQIMENDKKNGIVYADHYQLINGELKQAPVIDYQLGSVRDDFDFGSMLLFSSSAFTKIADALREEYKYAGLYAMRLFISYKYSIVHINEYLYTEIETDTRKSGEKQFDYVNPKNREVQIEMEAACTEYLKCIDAYFMPTSSRPVNLHSENFEFEASVIIPVRNRAHTIRDAVNSALNQRTTFSFNIIVIDNHSTDGTTEILQELSSDKRLIHIIPQEHDLGIGGCWNKGICHEKCGKFAIQLDSDDLYKDESTLQKIVDTFYKESCAMVIGTYLMTDFQLNEIPPGIIDHKEWTPENGKNNALRINGLGAPRAFYTPILRDIKLPNTSYGEDYAIGLRISREYKIGRIYDVIYLCRRWEGNSDAALSTEKVNRNNFYKDRIRTWEIKGRIQMHTIDEEFQELVEEMIENQKENWELAKRNYEALEENLEKKKAIIEKLNAIDDQMDTEEATQLVRDLMKEWNGIGHVPFKEKDRIYKQYHSQVDKLFEHFNISVSNKKLSNFKSTISSIQEGSPQALYREREKLVRAFDNMKNELQTYENNLGFLTTSSKKGNSLLTEINRKVEKLKADIELVKEKIKVVDENIKNQG